MNTKYRDFKEYFEKKYGLQLTKIITQYINENKICINDDNWNLKKFKVMKITFEKGEKCNQIKFYVSLKLLIEVKNKNIIEYWLGLLYEAELNHGLKNLNLLKCEEYVKKQYKAEKNLSKNLIPYFSVSSLDYHATKFLEKYCPQALEKPMALPVLDIANKMNLKIIYEPLNEDIFGKTYFIESEETMDNEEKKVISSGTIVINNKTEFMKLIESQNNTIIHECVHWEYHKNFFELQYLLNQENKPIVFKKEDIEFKSLSISNKIEWLEWQASALTPRILMPKKVTVEKFLSTIEKIKNQDGTLKNSQIYERAILNLANFFKVTKKAVKIRLLQLGFKNIIGINCYINKEYKPAYYFNYQNEDEALTYMISFKEAIQFRINNKWLDALMKERKLIYADGFFAINHKEYVQVSKKGKIVLTDYAREHVDECCIAFNIIGTFQSNLNNMAYSSYYICKNTSNQQNIKLELNMESIQNSRIIGVTGCTDIAFEEISEASKILDKMIGSFGECLNVLIQELGYKSNKIIGELVFLDEKTIWNYRKGKRIPELNKLLAICGGLKLHPRITYKLMEKAGYTIGNRGKQEDFIIMFLIEECYNEGLPSWNNRLEELDVSIRLP